MLHELSVIDSEPSHISIYFRNTSRGVKRITSSDRPTLQTLQTEAQRLPACQTNMVIDPNALGRLANNSSANPSFGTLSSR